MGTPVLLELGGKVTRFRHPSRVTSQLKSRLQDPCIILPSADTKFFAATWMRAALCVPVLPSCPSHHDRAWSAGRTTLADSSARSQAAGQNCIGVERFLVHSSIYDTFVTEMTTRVADLRVGDVLANARPEDKSKRVDVGAMVTDRLFDELEELIADAVKDGARCLVGGKRIIREEFPSGHYFAPTLLVDV